MNRKQRYSQGVRSPRGSRAHSRGVNLIELLIAMVLGLLVVGGAVSIFVTNQQTYAATESLGRIQENTRTAFELMARELREAGGNPCGRNLPAPGNLLNPGPTGLSNLGTGLTGYDGGQAMAAPALPAAGLASRIVGTDAFDISSAAGSGITVTGGNPVAAVLFLNMTSGQAGLAAGDILMVCDFRQAVIFQMSGPNSGANNNVVHNQGGAVAPGNCTQRFGLPVNCGPAGLTYRYGPNSTVARLAASRWYIGDNGRAGGNGANGRALFRGTVRAGVWNFQEIAEGVTDMQVTYLLRNAAAYVPAALVTAAGWGNVLAVNVTLTLAGQAQGETRVSSSGGALQRQVNYVIVLRNRSI